MAPDLLIIGEPPEGEDLSRRVEAFGYRSATTGAGELAHHLGEFSPAAILLCARGCDVRRLLSQLRQDPKGMGIPVILHSTLGGEIVDLADVMELGADRFLVAPVDDDELRETLLELLGPSEPAPLSHALGADAAELPLRHRDPLLAQLRRTLAALDERSEPPAGDSGGFDLDAIGLGGGPDLDTEVDVSASAHDLALIEVEPVTQPVVRSQRRAATLRIADEAEIATIPRPERREPAPTTSTPTSTPARGAQAGSRNGAPPETQRLTSRRSRFTADREEAEPIGEASEQGHLDEAPLPELLLRLEADRFSGLLRLTEREAPEERWAEQTVEVLFVEGAPVELRSDRPEDRLSAGLLRRGLVDAATARELRSRLANDSLADVDAAIDLGAIKPSERTSVASELLAELLTSAFSWAGTWSLHPTTTPTPGARVRSSLLDRPLATIIAEGILLELEEPTLRSRLGRGEARPRIRPGSSTSDLDPPVEARALGDLDGRLSVDDIGDIGGRPLLAWIYALQVLGRVLLDDPDELESADEERPSPSNQPDPEEESAATIDLRRIRTALGPAREGDYFALLGLPVGASRGELRRAHHQLRQTFADERLGAAARASMAAELKELRAALDEARDVLLDDALRAAYLAYRE